MHTEYKRNISCIDAANSKVSVTNKRLATPFKESKNVHPLQTALSLFECMRKLQLAYCSQVTHDRLLVPRIGLNGHSPGTASKLKTLQTRTQIYLPCSAFLRLGDFKAFSHGLRPTDCLEIDLN